jgi:hypothetical protein
LATLRSPLGKLGGIVQPTPAGLNEKKVERFIQTIKARKRAMLASLSYELPANLECESYMDAINWLNRLPNTSTAASQTPFQLVTGSKSFLPKFCFGQVGLFYSGDKESRSDWGLFAGYEPTVKYLRAYIPTRKLIYSRRRFIPQATVPVEWNFKNRIRAPDPVVRPTPPTQSPITLNQPVQFDEMTHHLVIYHLLRSYYPHPLQLFFQRRPTHLQLSVSNIRRVSSIPMLRAQSIIPRSIFWSVLSQILWSRG